MKEIIKELYPLHRTLVSDDMDKTLEIIGKHMPIEANYEIETFAPGMDVWTWKVPERYVVHEAYLETEKGNRILDFKDTPLHLVSYSEPIDKILTWEELKPHLHYSKRRTTAIPWVFKFYERSWGFCIQKEIYDVMPQDLKYHAVIKSEFISDPEQGLKVGTGVIYPTEKRKSLPYPIRKKKTEEFILCAHTCHPMQANDDLSGVAVLIELAKRLADNPLPENSMGVRFLFCPETIGSIAFLSQHEEIIDELKGGIFVDMAGNDNTLLLQRSYQDTDILDRISKYVLIWHDNVRYREAKFREYVGNDEMVINGPGVNVPCVSFNRWPYDEYHTSDDNMDIIHESKLIETADVIEEIVRIFCSNYTPRRLFNGPIFLSGYDLWNNVIPKRLKEEIMLSLEGDESVFDIAVKTGLYYWTVRSFINLLEENRLIERIED